MLQRNITDSVSVRFYVNNSPLDGDTHAPGHHRKWLNEIALKSILYPFILEILQWGGYVSFHIINNEGFVDESVIGNDNSFLSKFRYLWQVFYTVNWCITIYIVGFLSYQFVFVARLIVKDTVHLMSLFGRTSYLQVYPVYDFTTENRFLVRFFLGLANFVTMDLFNSYLDERIYSQCAEITRGDTPSPLPTLPYRSLHSPFQAAVEEDRERDPEAQEQCKMTPTEACELFSTFIAEVEALTTVFVPLNICLAFFSVANFITHIAFYAKSAGYKLSGWTLFRTGLFLAIAFRMMLCVQSIASVLGKLPPHINLIKTAGKLKTKEGERPDWSDFTRLLASYNLGKTSFGFPMTIRQIASFVTVMYMAFLIVFSVISKESHPTHANITSTVYTL